MVNVQIETGDRRRQMAKAIVEQLGESFFLKIKRAKTILLKVNLVDHSSPLACTHVDTVRGVVDAIRFYSGAPVFVGDGGYSGTKLAFKVMGYDRLSEVYEKVYLVDLNEDETVSGAIEKTGGDSEIRRSRLAVEADVKLSITPMKVDQETVVSLSIKNWTFGTWIVPSRTSSSGRVYAHWPWLRDDGETAYHASIARLYEDVPCDAVIVDGVTAMEGNGPIDGTSVEMYAMIGGLDAVAVDAVASTLMGIDPLGISYLRRLHEKQVGIADMAKINVPPILIHQLTKAFNR